MQVVGGRDNRIIGDIGRWCFCQRREQLRVEYKILTRWVGFDLESEKHRLKHDYLMFN